MHQVSRPFTNVPTALAKDLRINIKSTWLSKVNLEGEIKMVVFGDS